MHLILLIIIIKLRNYKYYEYYYHCYHYYYYYYYLVLLVVVAVATAFGPAKFTAQVKKAVGIASLGFALSGPAVMPVVADGAVSASTVFRARTNYGTKISELASAADSGKFDAFDDKKLVHILIYLFLDQTH